MGVIGLYIVVVSTYIMWGFSYVFCIEKGSDLCVFTMCVLSSICVTLLCIEVGRLFVLISSDKVLC